jgi:HEAT repeat protein
MDNKIERLKYTIYSAYNQNISPPDKVIEELATLGGDVVLPLLRIYSYERQDNNVIRVFKLIGEPALQVLSNFLEQEPIGETLPGYKDPQTAILNAQMLRKSAALALGAFGDARAIEPLVKIIEGNKTDEYWGTLCWGCAFGLARLGEAGLQKILELLATSDVKVLYWAIFAAGETKDSRVVKPLLELASHPDPAIRKNTIRALIETRTVEALDTYLTAITDIDNEVRHAAIYGLRRFEDPAIYQLIVDKIIEDPSERVKDAAIRSIEFNALRDKFYPVEEGRPFLLIKPITPENIQKAIDALLKALAQDENIKIRRLAAQALGILDATQAIPLLIKATRDKAKNPRAFQALARLNALELISDYLIELATDSDDFMRRIAALHLGKLKDPIARQLLLEMKDKDPSWVVRKAATEALKNIEKV